MDNLPVEISTDLFSRLPAHIILECKRVCKTWGNLLSLDKANFAAMHLLRHTHNPHGDDINGIGSSKVSTLGLILLGEPLKPKGTSHPLIFGEFDENTSDEQCIQNTLRPINHPLLRIQRKYDKRSLVSSCNGLICLVVNKKHDVKDPIHICNPVTRECLNLQGYNENNQYPSVHHIYSGFGYSSRTNEYKVVRILRSYQPKLIGQIQVYTLGAGSGWRNNGEITESLDSLCGVYFNGGLHWLQSHKNNIMVFDLSDEKFHVLPTPGPFPPYTYKITSILESFGEWLCVSGHKFHTPNPPKCLDIWTYKTTSSEKGIAPTHSKDESWSWCKKFSIRITLENSSAYDYQPFAVTESGLVLLEYKAPEAPYAQTLFCYNPKTATWRTLGTMNFLEVIPHTNSFISLTALGETKCNKKRKRRQILSSGGDQGSASHIPT